MAQISNSWSKEGTGGKTPTNHSSLELMIKEMGGKIPTNCTTTFVILLLQLHEVWIKIVEK